MNVREQSEARMERERRQWFVVLAFGVDGVDVDVPEAPAAPAASNILP
jgi:hypothetical protein